MFSIANTEFQETFPHSFVWAEFLSLSSQSIQYIAVACHFIKYDILKACLLVYFFHETEGILRPKIAHSCILSAWFSAQHIEDTQ